MTRDRMGRPPTLPQPWLDLAESVGGVDMLATVFHVHRRTIHKWATGYQTPGGLVRQEVNRFARAHGVKEPFS